MGWNIFTCYIITLTSSSVLASPAFLGDFLAIKVPGAVHHDFKVCVVVDGH
jgi:hypothetical protein